MRIRVDAGAGSFLSLCACGWRGMPVLSHGEALRQVRHHEQRAHVGHDNARRAVSAHRRRHDSRATERLR